MYLTTNLTALFAENALAATESVIQADLTALATGEATPSPAANPADWAISTLMAGNLGVLTENSQTIAEGINFLQTAAGAQQQALAWLQQLNNLAVQASNTDLTPTERDDLQTQASQILAALSTLNATTQYNGLSVFSNGASVTGVGGTDAPTATSLTIDPQTQTITLNGTNLPTVLTVKNNPSLANIATLPYKGTVEQWMFINETEDWRSGNSLNRNADPNYYEAESATSATMQVDLDKSKYVLAPGNTVAIALVSLQDPSNPAADLAIAQFVWPSTTTTFTFVTSGSAGGPTIDSVTVDPTNDTITVNGTQLPTTLTVNDVVLPFTGNVDQWLFTNHTEGWSSGNTYYRNLDLNQYLEASATQAMMRVDLSSSTYALNPGDQVSLTLVSTADPFNAAADLLTVNFIWPSTTTTITFTPPPTLNLGSGESLTLNPGSVDPGVLGLATVSLDTPESAAASLPVIQQAITQLTTSQEDVGGQLAALQAQATTVLTQHTALAQSQAAMEDVNLPALMSALARQQVLFHTGLQTLLSADQQPLTWRQRLPL